MSGKSGIYIRNIDKYFILQYYDAASLNKMYLVGEISSLIILKAAELECIYGGKAAIYIGQASLYYNM